VTEEQSKLVIAILIGLGEDVVVGIWPNQRCTFNCGGRSGGYYYSREFNHHSSCPKLLIDQLQKTTWNDDSNI
jgi:hypothetical protein